MTPDRRNAQFEALLLGLKNNRGFDFTGYKRSTLVRRVAKRMSALHVDTYKAYEDYLEAHPEVDGIAGWCWIYDEVGKRGFMPSCGLWAPDHLQWQPFPSAFAREIGVDLGKWAGALKSSWCFSCRSSPPARSGICSRLSPGAA